MSVVLAMVGQSMNDALGAATRAHKPMFDRLGLEFREINFSQPTASELLNQSIKDGDIAFAYSAMGMGGSLRTVTQAGQDLILWEAIEVPFISLMGDTPAYFFDRHVAPTNWHVPLYFFPDHHAVRKRYPLVPRTSGVIPPVPFRCDRCEADRFQGQRSKAACSFSRMATTRKNWSAHGAMACPSPHFSCSRNWRAISPPGSRRTRAPTSTAWSATHSSAKAGISKATCACGYCSWPSSTTTFAESRARCSGACCRNFPWTFKASTGSTSTCRGHAPGIVRAETISNPDRRSGPPSA